MAFFNTDVHPVPDAFHPDRAGTLSLILLFQKEVHLPCASCLQFTFKHVLLTVLWDLWHCYFHLSVLPPHSPVPLSPSLKAPGVRDQDEQSITSADFPTAPCQPKACGI